MAEKHTSESDCPIRFSSCYPRYGLFLPFPPRVAFDINGILAWSLHVRDFAVASALPGTTRQFRSECVAIGLQFLLYLHSARLFRRSGRYPSRHLRDLRLYRHYHLLQGTRTRMRMKYGVEHSNQTEKCAPSGARRFRFLDSRMQICLLFRLWRTLCPHRRRGARPRDILYNCGVRPIECTFLGAF